MTTYTAIPNADIDPESPITTGLMTLLRDNLLGVIEGNGPLIARAARTDPGALVHISTATLSASAEAVFTGLSTAYKAYVFIVSGLYASAGANFLVAQVSTDGGSTWKTTTNRYHTQNFTAASAAYAATVSTSASSMRLSGVALYTTSAAAHEGTYTLIGAGDAKINQIIGEFATGGLANCGKVFADYHVGATIDAIKFFGGGAANLTGEIAMYGVE